jgi:two-component sensor histidine kinase
MLLAKGSQTGLVDLHVLLREVAHAVASNLAAISPVELTVTLNSACLVVPRAASLLGAITGKLVANAIRYSHPARVVGQVSVSCGRGGDGRIIIGVTDDGVGLPEQSPHSKKPEFLLVRSLAGMVGGVLSFQSGELGLHCELQMPARYTHRSYDA